MNTHGGELKTYEVQVDNDKLTGYHVTLSRVLEALERNNANAGGAYLERVEQQSLIRGEALITSLADIENIVVGVLAERNSHPDSQRRHRSVRPDGPAGICQPGRERARL